MAIVLLNGPETKKTAVIYTLDTESHEIREDLLDRNTVQQQKVCGLGGYLEIGRFLKKRKVFVARYCDESSLYLWLDNQRFDFLNDDIEIRRKVFFIPKTKVQVLKNGSVAWEAYYKYHMQGEFPPEDIFEYMPDNSRESRVRSYLRCRDRLHGVDVFRDEYRKELEPRVKEWLETKKGKRESVRPS